MYEQGIFYIDTCSEVFMCRDLEIVSSKHLSQPSMCCERHLDKCTDDVVNKKGSHLPH